MNNIGQILKIVREERGLQLSDVQKCTGIDVGQLSRIENAVRFPTAEQVRKLSDAYGLDRQSLLVQWESDKIVSNLEYPDLASETLKAAEEKMLYGIKYLPLFQEYIHPKPIGIESRRYIGNKAKLTDWIMDTISKETKDVHSFCDLFGGTGVVASRALKLYDRVIVNDFLYSNEILYQAFFGRGEWDRGRVGEFIREWNDLDADNLEENYFSENYGGKFFGEKTSRVIGYIREQIEVRREELTEKEYAILIASLIYSIDRLSNTVGHFDAYIKKPITETKPVFRMIDAASYDGVKIYREDANILAEDVEADLFYLDPPYNSRQYSRFYHVYETLVKWDAPELFGTALKPAPENMSRYCTTRARDAFKDLVGKMKARYIVVSYNNTYHSKSKSSENKIRLEDIEKILNEAGETKVFEHSYQAFTTGKTEFSDHKELLFITKVDDERRSKAFAPLLRWR